MSTRNVNCIIDIHKICSLEKMILSYQTKGNLRFYFFYDNVNKWKSRCKKYFKYMSKKIKKYIDTQKNICYIWKVLWENSNDLWKLSKTSTLRQLGLNKKQTNKINFFMRVWSWLRMNAGGMPKTCKSNETAQWRWSACTKSDLDSRLVAQGWVTRG